MASKRGSRGGPKIGQKWGVFEHFQKICIFENSRFSRLTAPHFWGEKTERLVPAGAYGLKAPKRLKTCNLLPIYILFKDTPPPSGPVALPTPPRRTPHTVTVSRPKSDVPRRVWGRNPPNGNRRRVGKSLRVTRRRPANVRAVMASSKSRPRDAASAF